jgi:CubicO group peptidase (beta-lactamase class C family)
MSTFNIRSLKGTMNLTMKTVVAGCLCAGTLIAHSQALTASHRLDRITRVENGLLPPFITTDTPMQAAGISKAVAAVAALRLVDQGKLGLDADLNSVLRAWQIPPGAQTDKQTADKPVTLRRVLSHSAGLTVSGYLGYAPGTAVPTTVQILDGLPPANSAPVAWASSFKARVPSSATATMAATWVLKRAGWPTKKTVAAAWW